jgi:hypothetical protein
MLSSKKALSRESDRAILGELEFRYVISPHTLLPTQASRTQLVLYA